jgi:hypothetical protein
VARDSPTPRPACALSFPVHPGSAIGAFKSLMSPPLHQVLPARVTKPLRPVGRSSITRYDTESHVRRVESGHSQVATWLAIVYNCKAPTVRTSAGFAIYGGARAGCKQSLATAVRVLAALMPQSSVLWASCLIQPS